MNADKKEKLAQEMKKEIQAVSLFIQRHTSLVCPECKNVCCVNKHGSYDRDDVLFIESLGIRTPAQVSDRGDMEPCRYLSTQGCSLERWRRPFRCTWYFCEPLLESMKNDRGKIYREFINSLQRLMSTRLRLLDGGEIP